MTQAFRKTPLAVILVILSFIAPTELSLVIGDLRLSPHRVVFLIFLPIAIHRMLTRPDCQLHLYDAPFLGLAIWQTAVFTFHAGTAGLAFGGSLALESLGGYAIARAYIRDLETLRATLQVMFCSIVAAGVIATLDTISASYFVHDLLRSTMGGDPMPPVEFRQGLARAASTFDHPIHYGTYCATMFALMWMSEPDRVRRYARAIAIAVAAGLAMSSAPLLSLVMQGLLMAWNRATRGVAFRTQLTIAVLAGLYIGAALTANRPPMQILISIATFDPWTGLYRMMIWTHGLQNLWGSPWMGIGLEDWVRPDWMVSPTIDAYWLVLSMRAGLPALLLLATGIGLLGRGVVVRGTRADDGLRRRMAVGWLISLLAFCLLGATVHFWNVPHSLFYFFLGLGSALADPSRVAGGAAATITADRHARRRHPSFDPFARPVPRPAPEPVAA